MGMRKGERQGGHACEDVGVGAHGAADQDGLADHLVVDGDERVVRRERARAALAVHQQPLGHAVHQVLLHLRKNHTIIKSLDVHPPQYLIMP